MVTQAAPDGYTIGYGNILNIAIVRSFLPNLSYDPERDLQMVTLTGTTPNLLAASLALPANSVAELIDFAKKNPDKLFYGYAGTGSSNHLSGELLKLMTGMHNGACAF
jgi:tripartite-type tricarboxylate transporter receptor subunit TctC